MNRHRFLIGRSMDCTDTRMRSDASFAILMNWPNTQIRFRHTEHSLDMLKMFVLLNDFQR